MHNGTKNGNGKAQSRRVDLLKGDDFTCALLGSLGFSSKCIMSHTSLSTGQISYRLRLGGIRRVDYRNGQSRIASSVMARSRGDAVPLITEQLRNIVKEARLRNECRGIAPINLRLAATASPVNRLLNND